MPQQQFTISLDPQSVSATKALLDKVKDGANKALVRALNATRSKARTATVREITKDIRIKASEVKPKLKETKAVFQNPVAKIKTPLRGLRMARFVTTAMPEGRPIRTKVKPRGKAKKWETAWIMKLKNSGVYGVFIREGNRNKHVYGPSLSQVMRKEITEGTLSADMQAELEVQLDKKTNDVLRQFGSK